LSSQFPAFGLKPFASPCRPPPSLQLGDKLKRFATTLCSRGCAPYAWVISNLTLAPDTLLHVNKVIQYTALVACSTLLAACVVAPPPPPAPDPHIAAMRRAEQIEVRIDHESHSIDGHVAQGFYPPPQGARLHQRLAGIQQEEHDMAAQRGGGLSGEEQRALNQQLDATAQVIGQ